MSRRHPPRDVIDPIAHDPDPTDPLGPGAVDPGPTDPLGPGAVDPDPAEVLDRMRPAPPRSWRERVDDLLVDLRSGPRPGAAATLAVGGLATVVAVLVVIVAWQVTTAPAAAPEAELPRATASTDPAAAAGPAPGADRAAAPHPAGGPSTAPGAGASTAAGGVAAGGVAAGEVVVHVVGAVEAPGVQRLPAGARVADAIEAAGGATADADMARVNLAATVTDGAQIVVPRPGEVVAPVAPVAPTPVAGSPAAPGSPDGAAPVNVNSATAAELEELPGVGPVTAAAIVGHRDEYGPFATVDQLIDVRGIGEAKLEQLRPRATV